GGSSCQEHSPLAARSTRLAISPAPRISGDPSAHSSVKHSPSPRVYRWWWPARRGSSSSSKAAVPLVCPSSSSPPHPSRGVRVCVGKQGSTKHHRNHHHSNHHHSSSSS